MRTTGLVNSIFHGLNLDVVNDQIAVQFRRARHTRGRHPKAQTRVYVSTDGNAVGTHIQSKYKHIKPSE